MISFRKKSKREELRVAGFRSCGLYSSTKERYDEKLKELKLANPDIQYKTLNEGGYSAYFKFKPLKTESQIKEAKSKYLSLKSDVYQKNDEVNLLNKKLKELQDLVNTKQNELIRSKGELQNAYYKLIDSNLNESIDNESQAI